MALNRWFIFVVWAWGCSAMDDRDKSGDSGSEPVDRGAGADEADHNAGPDDGEGGESADSDDSDGPADPSDPGDTGDEHTGDDDDETLTAEDEAIVVSVELPHELDCGGSQLATIEMRNTGLSTWTGEAGYKLGAVDDSDPLHALNNRIWLPEGVAVAPGENYVFEFELTAPSTSDDYLTDWRMVHEDVRWFGETASQTVAVTCGVQTFCDPLTDAALQTGFGDKRIEGGSFSADGWQSTHGDDQLLLALSAPIRGDGTFEIHVTNFDPLTQYTGTKHQIINMYTSDNGSQDVFETNEAWWNIRTGSNYGTGYKVLVAPNGGDSREEARLIESATWDPADIHTFTVEWNSEVIDFYLDGTHMETLAYNGRVEPLQHIFIGKDNVYEGQVGPIYTDLCVTYYP